MLHRVLAFAAAAVTAIAISWSAVAGPNGSADEAKALADKAAALIASAGAEKAYQAFNDPAGGFVDRDLYVFVINFEGVTVAHGGNKALVGKSLAMLKDADGKPFIQEMIKLARDAGTGWVEYKWANPATKKIEPKASYVKKVGDTLVGVGIYKG